MQVVPFMAVIVSQAKNSRGRGFKSRCVLEFVCLSIFTVVHPEAGSLKRPTADDSPLKWIFSCAARGMVGWSRQA